MGISKKILWIAIIVLVIINLSVLGTILYRVQKAKAVKEARIEFEPGNQPWRCYRNELNLTDNQHLQFKQFRMEYQRKANQVTHQMRYNRQKMITELGKKESDTTTLHQLAFELGEMHAELKHLTFEYYLQMKSVCTPEQKDKLFIAFSDMINKDNNLNIPNRHRGRFRR
jgi:Spy/CpxP family protein refolding chaperone